MFNLIEDRPTPKEVYNWRIYVFATIAAFGATTFGYDASFFGTTLARASFQKVRSHHTTRRGMDSDDRLLVSPR